MRNIFRRAGYVMLPIIILLLAVLLKWESISYFGLRKVAQFYAGKADIALDIGTISGNPFNRTTLENVSVRPGDGQPQPYKLKTRSISCSYTLRDLKDGIELFIQGLNCTANDPEFVYDLRVAAAQDQSSHESKQFLFPALLPGLDVHNGTLLVTDSDWDAEARKVNLSLRSAAGHELLIEAKKFRFNQEDVTRIETGFTSKLLYSNSQLTIDALELGEKEISATGFIDLAKIDTGVTGFGADIVFDESQLSMSGSMENGLLQTHVKTENFDIGELQKRLGSTGWDISGKIRSEADLAYNLELKQDLNSTFTIDIQGGWLHGVAIDSFTLTGSLDDKILHISSAEALSPENHLLVNGVSVPVPLLLGGDTFSIIGGTTGKFAVSSKDFTTILQLIKADKDLLPEGIKPNSLKISGSLDRKILNISSAEAIVPDNHFLINEVSVPVPLLQTGDTLSILGGTTAKFGFESTDPVPLLQLVKIDTNILPEGIRPDSLKLHGYLKQGIIYLDDASAMTSDSSLVIDRATIPVPATVEAFESVPINLTARFTGSNLKELAGLFGNFPLVGQVSADMDITGSMKEPKTTVHFTGEHLGYEKLQLGSIALLGEISIRQEKPGTIKSLQFTVTEMMQTNDSGTIALLSPATGTWQREKFSLDAIFQVGEQGEAAIEINKTPAKEIAVKINTGNLDSEGWLENFIDKRYFFHGADIEALFTGPMKNPQVQLEGTIGEVGGKGIDFPVTGKFALQYSSKGIKITEFTWKSHEKNQLTITGFLPYDPMISSPFLDGELILQGNIDFPALEGVGIFLAPLGIGKGSLAMDVELTGSWKEPLGHILLRADSVEPPDILKPYNELPLSLTCDITAESGSIVLKSASLESTDYSATATGTWQHGFSVKELLQNRKAELRGEVSADATVDLKNLNFLKEKLPWLRRFDGSPQVTLHVTGPVSDPSFQGSFFLNDGEISHTFNFPTFAEVNLQGEFNKHSITLSRMQAEVGGSPVSLNGRINREQDAVDVSLQLEGKNVLLFRNNDMRLRGDVKLEVSGPLERLVIKGTTGLTGGYYNRNIDFLGKIGSSSTPVSEGAGFLFSFTDPPLKDAVLDIRVTSSEPFRIRNNLVRGSLRPELTLKGTGELPFLVGTVYIDPSRVLLPSGRLQVQSGLLRFLENTPDRPQLDLLANSKVQGYDINVITQGTVDDPVITLSSSPALPNDDLLLLLLTGQLPTDKAASGTLGRGTQNVMVYLGRDFLNKWLEDDSATSDETILDRFELDYGRGVTKSGEQTIESTFRLSEETNGKNRAYYLSGEKDRYDAYNYGLRVVFRFE